MNQLSKRLSPFILAMSVIIGGGIAGCVVRTPGPVDVVDEHGWHHHGYYDDQHAWHGGYYDDAHAYHDDPPDWRH